MGGRRNQSPRQYWVRRHPLTSDNERGKYVWALTTVEAINTFAKEKKLETGSQVYVPNHGIYEVTLWDAPHYTVKKVTKPPVRCKSCGQMPRRHLDE